MNALSAFKAKVTPAELVACNNRIGRDAPCRIEVLPLHGLGLLVVRADVAHAFSLHVIHGSGHASGDDIERMLRAYPLGVITRQAVFSHHDGLTALSLQHKNGCSAWMDTHIRQADEFSGCLAGKHRH